MPPGVIKIRVKGSAVVETGLDQHSTTDLYFGKILHDTQAHTAMYVHPFREHVTYLSRCEKLVNSYHKIPGRADEGM